jgi:MoxR-like ATPase
MLVFADRNRLEREETFELPSAARDRFLMEIAVEIPDDPDIQRLLMFDTRFHSTDLLLDGLETALFPYTELNHTGARIQRRISASDVLQRYAMDLVAATRDPAAFGVNLSDTDGAGLVRAGVSPRGMSMLLRAARTVAWLQGRDRLVPEDLRSVFRETVAHRMVFEPVYELQRAELLRELMDQILARVSAP